jgi:hypothetical protein
MKVDAQKAIEAGDLAKADALLANAEKSKIWASQRSRSLGSKVRSLQGVSRQ